MTDHGYIERDFAADPIGSDLPLCEGLVHGESEWRELMALQDQRRSSPMDFHLSNDVPLIDQSDLKYCWAFCIAAGCMSDIARGADQELPQRRGIRPRSGERREERNCRCKMLA